MERTFTDALVPHAVGVGYLGRRSWSADLGRAEARGLQDGDQG